MEWQPMETAPRDGTKIVLTAWDDWNQLWRFRVSWWRKYLEPHGEGFALDFHPMYWMPEPKMTVSSNTVYGEKP